MRLIDADAFDRMLEGAQAECRRNGGNFRVGVLSTVRANLAKMPTIGGWISVKDRLPGEDGTYFCSREIFPFARFYIIVWFSLERNAFWDYKGNCEVRHITHWMPLPEPPEEVSGDE